MIRDQHFAVRTVGMVVSVRATPDNRLRSRVLTQDRISKNTNQYKSQAHGGKAPRFMDSGGASHMSVFVCVCVCVCAFGALRIVRDGLTYHGASHDVIEFTQPLLFEGFGLANINKW